MELIESYIFNKINYLEFNSTLGQYVGYTELGIKNAERLNKDTARLQSLKADVERVCKGNAKIYYSAILSKTGEIICEPENLLLGHISSISSFYNRFVFICSGLFAHIKIHCI